MIPDYKLLSRYINVGCLSRKDQLLALVSNKLVFRKNAGKVIATLNANQRNKLTSISKINVSVKPYSGNNLKVQKMMQELYKLKESLLGAYLHGSLATGEAIRYSDFDALVIIKNEVFQNEEKFVRLAEKLNGLQKIMWEYDPLQHHGWFVLSEKMLQNYPLNYFPIELFEYTVSLLPNQGRELEIKYENKDWGELYKKSFYSLSSSLLKKKSKREYTFNAFYLKALLSEFMLLPALYIPARYGRSIYKKESFSEARKDFTKEEWKVMDQVSEIREAWDYQIEPSQIKELSNLKFPLRKKARKKAPTITKEVQEKIEPQLFVDMEALILAMQNKM